MGMVLGGNGLLRWRGIWRREPCPLGRVDLLAAENRQLAAVDNASHGLWVQGRTMACPRDVQSLALWQGHGVILSADTGCVSIADGVNWLSTARVGVNPQDMCVQGQCTWVCGGEDGLVHHLHLPDLRTMGTFEVAGMPMRLAVDASAAWVLSLLAEEPVRTALIRLDLRSGEGRLVAELPGLPSAVGANERGAWAAAGEQLTHFPIDGGAADALIEGFGDVSHVAVQGDSALVTAEGLAALVSAEGVQVLHRGDVRQGVFAD